MAELLLEKQKQKTAALLGELVQAYQYSVTLAFWSPTIGACSAAFVTGAMGSSFDFKWCKG